jgi:four helix bundle protein
MQRFTELKVWQRAHTLVLEVYRLTATFPAEERFGLTAQLRRAAISVAANLAEGSKRQHNRDYARFLNVAEGSAAEAEYLLLLSRDLGYAGAARAEPLLAEVTDIARMLHALRTKVESGI